MVMSNPRAELPEEAKHVPPEDGPEYGYHGAVPDLEPNSVYSIAGVTGTGSGAGNKQSDAAKLRAEKNTDALRSKP